MCTDMPILLFAMKWHEFEYTKAEYVKNHNELHKATEKNKYSGAECSNKTTK